MARTPPRLRESKVVAPDPLLWLFRALGGTDLPNLSLSETKKTKRSGRRSSCDSNGQSLSPTKAKSVEFKIKIPPSADINDLLKWCDLVKISEGLNSDTYYVPSANKIVKIIPLERQKGKKSKEAILNESWSEFVVLQSLKKMMQVLIPQDGPTNLVQPSDIKLLKGKQDVKKDWSRGPVGLISAFDGYGETRMKDPRKYGAQQEYLYCVTMDPGFQLTKYRGVNPLEAMSIILQIGLWLASAENACEFTINYLPLESIWLKSTGRRYMTYTLNKAKFRVKTHGLIARMSDFSASRLRVEEQDEIIFKDLNQFPELFDGSMDRFKIFHQMRQLNDKNWAKYVPKTNLLWYAQLIEGVYSKTLTSNDQAQSSDDCYQILSEINRFIENCDKSEGVSHFLQSQLPFLTSVVVLSIQS